jgi:hypothetical protein
MADPYEEAERLMRDAQRAAADAAAAAGPEQPPPRGWDVPHAEPAPPFPDLSALFGLVEALKGTVPPELVQQLSDALRELLIALRAILDYSIARLERPPGESAPVEDIPVE